MGYCNSKVIIKNQEIKINEIIQDENVFQYPDWEKRFTKQIDNLYDISAIMFSKNKIEIADFYYEKCKQTKNINIKLGLLIKALRYNNTNESIIIEFLTVLKKSPINKLFNEYFGIYEKILSLNSLNKYFPNEKRKNISQKDSYFKLINDFTCNNELDDFIKNYKIQFETTEIYIPNQPVSYQTNQEIFFYFQISNFINFFFKNRNINLLQNRKTFLLKYENIINYFQNNLEKNIKEIDIIFFIINFCTSIDEILPSFNTILNPDLSFEQIKSQIFQNKNIKDVQLIDNNLKIILKNGKNLILENYMIYDTYCLVDYFKINDRINENEKFNLVKFNYFQKYNFCQYHQNILNLLFKNFIYSKIANDLFYKIRNNNSPIDYNSFINLNNFYEDLFENKIIFYPFNSNYFSGITLKFFNKIFIRGFYNYNTILVQNKLNNIVIFSKLLYNFEHEFQHFINTEIAFYTKDVKYFSSFSIGIHKGESGNEFENILFGGTKDSITINQAIFILTSSNYEITISEFKNKFNVYEKNDNNDFKMLLSYLNETNVGKLMNIDNSLNIDISDCGLINLKSNSFNKIIIRKIRIKSNEGFNTIDF